MSDLPFAMKRTIAVASLGLAGVGVGGAFAAHADLVLIAPAWAAMFIKLANSALAYTVLGTLPAMAFNAGINALMTWLVGRAWAHVLLEGHAEQSVDNLVRALLAAVLGTGVVAA